MIWIVWSDSIRGLGSRLGVFAGQAADSAVELTVGGYLRKRVISGLSDSGKAEVEIEKWRWK